MFFFYIFIKINYERSGKRGREREKRSELSLTTTHSIYIHFFSWIASRPERSEWEREEKKTVDYWLWSFSKLSITQFELTDSLCVSCCCSCVVVFLSTGTSKLKINNGFLDNYFHTHSLSRERRALEMMMISACIYLVRSSSCMDHVWTRLRTLDALPDLIFRPLAWPLRRRRRAQQKKNLILQPRSNSSSSHQSIPQTLTLVATDRLVCAL